MYTFRQTYILKDFPFFFFFGLLLTFYKNNIKNKKKKDTKNIINIVDDL